MITEFKELYLPVIMSVFLAYIAYQQLITNRNKLKQDLYNKRFEVYTDTLILYQELSDTEGTSKETLRRFISSKESSKFLFSNDPSIYELLNEVHHKSFKVNGVKKNKVEFTGNSEAYKEMNEALNWLTAQLPILSQKLDKYLS